MVGGGDRRTPLRPERSAVMLPTVRAATAYPPLPFAGQPAAHSTRREPEMRIEPQIALTGGVGGRRRLSESGCGCVIACAVGADTRKRRAAEQMGDALLVNPYSAEEMADAICQALRMPRDERVRRWEKLMAGVQERDVTWWADRFLAALRRAEVDA